MNYSVDDKSPTCSLNFISLGIRLGGGERNGEYRDMVRLSVRFRRSGDLLGGTCGQIAGAVEPEELASGRLGFHDAVGRRPSVIGAIRSPKLSWRGVWRYSMSSAVARMDAPSISRPVR